MPKTFNCQSVNAMHQRDDAHPSLGCLMARVGGRRALVRQGLAAAIVLGIVPGDAYALCAAQDGPPVMEACMIRGKPGTRSCAGGPCVPDDAAGVQGTVVPKYLVITILYAPPGTKGGPSSSSVKYTGDSTAGTTTSASRGFNQGYSVAYEKQVGTVLVEKVDATFTYARSSASSQSVDIKKTAEAEISSVGPSTDGIDHNQDLIVIWLNPAVDLTLDSKSAAWMFDGNASAEVHTFSVAQLKQLTPIVDYDLARLKKAGITPADYPDILAHDPFAVPGAKPDPSRFRYYNTTFPYEPPTPPIGQSTYSLTLTNDVTDNKESTATDSYKVGLTASGTANLILFRAALTVDGSWEWTSTASKSNSSEHVEKASLTVGSPSADYNKPDDSTVIKVYYDLVYRTFAFVPVPRDAPIGGMKGLVLDPRGQPLAHKEVTATAGGKTYRTVTNASGEYRFVDAMAGPAEVRSEGAVQSVPQSGPDVSLRLQAPPKADLGLPKLDLGLPLGSKQLIEGFK